MLTDEELAQIQERCARATPGPWTYTPGILKHYVASENDDVHLGLQEMHPADGREVPAGADATFIAHAREDVPALLAEVQRLRKLEQAVTNLVTAPASARWGLSVFTARLISVQEWEAVIATLKQAQADQDGMERKC